MINIGLGIGGIFALLCLLTWLGPLIAAFLVVGLGLVVWGALCVIVWIIDAVAQWLRRPR